MHREDKQKVGRVHPRQHGFDWAMFAGWSICLTFLGCFWLSIILIMRSIL